MDRDKFNQEWEDARREERNLKREEQAFGGDPVPAPRAAPKKKPAPPKLQRRHGESDIAYGLRKLELQRPEWFKRETK